MSCEQFHEAIRQLQSQLQSLEEAMQSAQGEERGSILAQIKLLIPKLREKQEELQRCLASAPTTALPPVVDYQPYLTLLRTQDGWGGCGGMATMHAFDIQMERVAPYSPDGSAAFNGFVYNDSKGLHPSHDPRVAEHDLNQTQLLKVYGSCPETSFPTNYDPPRPVFPNETAPSDENFAEAKCYRATEIGGEPGDTTLPYGGIAPKSIDELKKLLFEKGPLICLGASDGHVVTLIGYNDNTKTIKYVNSVSRSSGWGGIQDRPDVNYDYFMDRFRNHGASVKWIEIDPVKLVQQAPPVFTARIKTNHAIGRRFLTVRIGVEGQSPLVVWDRNCSVNMQDDYLGLCIDVPLPEYARQFWPPSKGNWWYAEVTDNSPSASPATVGHIDDVALVQRLFGSNGSCKPILFRSSYRNFEIRCGGTVRVFIPSRKTCFCSLGVDLPQVSQGSSVSLSGMVTVQLSVSNTQNPIIPLAAKRVCINRVDHKDPLEGAIEYPVGQTESDDQGHFVLSTVVDRTTRYRAIATETDGTMLAVSDYAEVNVA